MGQGCLAAGSAAIAVLAWQPADWDPGLFALLLSLAAVSGAFPLAVRGLRISGSFIALVLAMCLLGPALAAVLGLAVVAVDTVRVRPDLQRLVSNGSTYIAFPVAGGLLFRVLGELEIGVEERLGFSLVVLAVFLASNLLNFLLVATDIQITTGAKLLTNFRQVYLPVVPVEIATGLLTAGVAYVYMSLGIGVVACLAMVGMVFQYLLYVVFEGMKRGEELEGRTRELAALQVGLLATVLRTLSLRDRMTARHSAAVARYAREVAKALGLPEEEQETVHTAGLLHDIGKFIFPDTILFAAAKLDDEQWAIVKRHPEQGAALVRKIEGWEHVAEIIHAHHERVDGRGYPRGLEGEAIPLASRIISVADTYDVMTARDSYREPVPPAEAVAELRRVSGGQLDPRVVDAFIEVLQSKAVTFSHSDNADFEFELNFKRRVADYARPRRAAA